MQLLAQAALQARAAAVGLAAALSALPPPVVVQVQPRSAAPAHKTARSKSLPVCCRSLRNYQISRTLWENENPISQDYA